ncbi:Ankyrin repeat domain-containing protein SOWAHB [Habropoda laboriosa]|uniref:Ankyrin repeat domain-containing protein SOWAHB n=1 Tax=Habropoda laboriosa TaxID=597456 RepID=A0A0L7QZR6_9HYME|nr:Ankyrin repeat domain-containing protein SOWAHB [Habropoda laboriosa]
MLQTALHWAAKHGDEDIVKLIAGTYKEYIKSVNETTGYTPLHIAMQFDHENIFNLLVQVYGANQEIRDYSGKKARQYLVSQEAAVSQDTFRKIKARKKHAEKEPGFLRIGSLNVRVKRTTEAFSQFLGVATSSASSNHEKIHKNWGSADNVQFYNIGKLGCSDPVKISTTFNVYIELCEAKKYWEVNYKYNESLDLLYLEVKRRKSSQLELFVPWPALSNISLDKIEKIQEALNVEKVSFVFKAEDSTSIIYRVSKGLVKPMTFSMLTHYLLLSDLVNIASMRHMLFHYCQLQINVVNILN